MPAKISRWLMGVCLVVASARGLAAQTPPVEGDIDAIREVLRRTNSSGPWLKQNAARRIADWKAAAEKGSSEAMWLLGRCLVEGYGGAEPDQEKGWALIKEAAGKGCALAQNSLGYMYGNGEGVEKDAKQAAAWYRKSAEQGEAAACNNLASLYEEGSGVEANEEEAVRWYAKAAAARFVASIRRLAAVYDSGRGDVKADGAAAAKWYRKLGEAGDPKGTARAALIYQEGRGTPKDAAQAARCLEELKGQAGAGADNLLLLVDVLDGAVGKKIPEIKGVIDGKPFKLSDSAGKVVVLRFGASWCGYCRKMNPKLEALSKTYGAKDFAVIDVDVDTNRDVAELWEVHYVPLVYVIDHTGVIRDVCGWSDDLDKPVADLLAKAGKNDKRANK